MYFDLMCDKSKCSDISYIAFKFIETKQEFLIGERLSLNHMSLIYLNTVIFDYAPRRLYFSGMSRCGAYSRVALIRGRRSLKDLIERSKNYFKNSNIFSHISASIYKPKKVKFILSHNVYILVGLIITVYYLHTWHASPTSESSKVKGSTGTSDKILVWV